MSSERTRIGCVVVAHGAVAECLMTAVQGIIGTQTGWEAVSNKDKGLKELTDTVNSAIDRLTATHDVVLLTDMPGGSCHHVCQMVVKERPEVRGVAGVNLMMLLEFFVKRDRHGLDELVALVQTRGRDAVRVL